MEDNKNKEINKKLVTRRNRKDLFWPVIIICSLISFVISYWLFIKITSDVETRTIKTSKPVYVSPIPSQTPDGTIMIGDGQGTPSPEGTPSDGATNESSTPVTPNPVDGTATPIPQETKGTTPTPAPTATITVLSVPSPTVVSTPIATPKVEKVKKIFFKVRVGSYQSRSEAEKVGEELRNMGYESKVIEEPEGSYVQMGSFKDQQKALVLAEEISQKGYSVIIRQDEIEMGGQGSGLY